MILVEQHGCGLGKHGITCLVCVVFVVISSSQPLFPVNNELFLGITS